MCAATGTARGRRGVGDAAPYGEQRHDTSSGCFAATFPSRGRLGEEHAGESKEGEGFGARELTGVDMQMTKSTLHLGTPNPKQDRFLRAACRHVAYGASPRPRGTSGCEGKSPWGTARRRRI